MKDPNDTATLELPTIMAVGDINSSAKGTGARANGGKPDYSLLPLLVQAESILRVRPDNYHAEALRCLGSFQITGRPGALFEALVTLGDQWDACARVFEYGKRKYAAWNWAKGMPWSVPLACAARHLMALLRGEQTDPESGEPHEGHVYCNLLMLLTFVTTYPEGNDLPPAGMLG